MKHSSAWLYILGGGCFEMIWAVCMKLSHGFTDPLYTLLTLAFLFVSTHLLYGGLNRGIPVGVGYAVWVGIGAVCSVFAGILLFGELFAAARMIALGAVIAGIVGLQMTEPKKHPKQESE